MIQNTKPIIEWNLNEIKQECKNTALCRDCRIRDVCNLLGSDKQPRLWEFPEYNFDKYNDLLEKN